MNDLSYTSPENAKYMEELFHSFQKNPDSIDPDWKRFFEGMEFGYRLSPRPRSGGKTVEKTTEKTIEKEQQVLALIEAYRDRGHSQAQVNPLKTSPSNPDFALEKFTLSSQDLSTPFSAGSKINRPNATLQEIITHLEKAYCGTITVESTGLPSELHQWITHEFESPQHLFNTEDKLEILKDLNATEALEHFFHSRFVGMKRFSIEGADALITMLESLVHQGVQGELKEIVLGMAHRGRINVLTNFMGKALELVFAEFDGHYSPETSYADGDVKYHMGFSTDKEAEHGTCHISLAFNPSHLEAVTPVVIGTVRAKQRIRKDSDRKQVLPILIHGDAALIAQGVVSETLQLSQLPGYRVGGSIHIVLNNQIGFTTDPNHARSTTYCTDVAKQLNTPIIHVNGDDVEACIRAMNIAYRFREKFSKDIVIDMICYRRHGHNEGDEPAFTQPLLYKKIKAHPTLRQIYGKKLTEEEILTEKNFTEMYDKELAHLQAFLEKSRKTKMKIHFETLGGAWTGLRRSTPQDFETSVATEVPSNRLQEITQSITKLPENFKVLSKLQRIIDARSKMIDTGKIDWGMGELLTYGSLVQEGTIVRLSGQDVERGTFSHRHAIYTDCETGEKHNPLNNINSNAKFYIYNSPLSEYAVLGFEFGNSTTDPRALTIWEAQFGDFANGAQIIIDQFLCSAESKWQRMSGLVLLLPHGYEGQGPEHSNARPERFLQLCAQYNMQVCNLTTPAQFFHALRRQVKRDFRKPLIIMSPKALLRHPKVVSTIDDFENKRFQEIIPDKEVGARKVKRCILTSGKIFYEIYNEREKQEKKSDTAIIRIEQYYPFPTSQLLQQLKRFNQIEELIWAQEEPRNMGPYSFVSPLISNVISRLQNKPKKFRYVGRSDRSSPAIGTNQLHKQEQEEIIKGCFSEN